MSFRKINKEQSFNKISSHSFRIEFVRTFHNSGTFVTSPCLLFILFPACSPKAGIIAVGEQERKADFAGRSRSEDDDEWWQQPKDGPTGLVPEPSIRKASRWGSREEINK